MADLNFNGGGTGESATITVSAGQLVRVRWTNFGGSAACRFKTVSGGVTSYQTITDKEIAVAVAFAGDVISVVYDGQGNPASVAQGVFEVVS